MDTPLDRHCNEVPHSATVGDLLRRMVTFSEDRGFGRISATVITEHSPTLEAYQYLTNAPADDIPEFEDLGAAHVDPVSRHAAIHSTPLVWNRSTSLACGQDTLWERQAPFGYRSGIVVGFHLPRGRHFLFGPDSDQASCTAPPNTRPLVEDFHLFAAHAQAAAFELCTRCAPPTTAPRSPSPSELEALRWTIDGMTNWEIGRKMYLSEWDVKLRLRRVMRKVGVSSKYEAVLKGIRLGLIEGV